MYEISDLINLTGFRFFYDFLQGFLFYLRVFGIDFGSSLTYYNTESLLGRHESIIPTGYLAFGYAQASFFGVMITGILYRVCFNILERSKIYKAAKSEPLTFYLSFLAANTFYTGEWRTLLIGFVMPAIVMNISISFMIKRR